MRLCNHARLVSASHSRPPSVFSAIRFPDLLITVAAWPAECSSATCFPDLLITVATWPAECFFCLLFPRSSDHRNCRPRHLPRCYPLTIGLAPTPPVARAIEAVRAGEGGAYVGLL